MTTRRTSTGTTIGTAKPRAARRSRSVAEAARTGTRRELLEAMRDRIARTISKDDCPPRDLASLTRRLQDIVKEIEAIDAAAKEEERARAGATVEDGDFDASAV